MKNNVEKEKLLTQEIVKEYLNYDRETGILTWRIRVGQRGIAGSEAGHFVKAVGYRGVKLNGKNYRTHRIIWLWMFGEFPRGEIDHINHDKIDNRISNLRVVSTLENCRNRALHKNNKSGTPGVQWHKLVGKWEVSIRIKGKYMTLGYFDWWALGAAIAMRKSAEEKYGFHPNHGSVKVK